jgi:hypothetical protein
LPEGDVPVAVLTRVRGICGGLPEVREESAWIGVRWQVRGRTFAHLLTIEDGTPQAHARAAGTDGPATALTFRAPEAEIPAYRVLGAPFFFGGWGRDVVGLLIDASTDWAEVAELLTESYCVLAPAKLAERVTRP